MTKETRAVIIFLIAGGGEPLSADPEKGDTNMKITKETVIGEVLDFNPDTAQFFFEIGMHCLGCPHSRGESIEEACMVHGTDATALVDKLNAFLGNK